MRSGIAPFGGSGGSGVVLARLPDGSWSSPSFITPQNVAVGLMLGFDVYDVVLLVMTPSAMEGFMSHKFTVGAEGAVAAGPVGMGGNMDYSLNGSSEWKQKPMFSYVRSRGAYVGAEAMAQALATRFDENERVYHWPGITGREILTGKVRKPPQAAPLYQALAAAEAGTAQQTLSDLRLPPELEAELGGAADVQAVVPGQAQPRGSNEGGLTLDEGECMHLPPTPEMLAFMEKSGIKDDDDLRIQAENHKLAWTLPEPPRHPDALRRKAGINRTKAGGRFVAPASSSSNDKDQGRFMAPVPNATTALLSASSAQVVDVPPSYSSGPTVVAPPEKAVLIDPNEPAPLLPTGHPSARLAHGEVAPALPSNHPTEHYQPTAVEPCVAEVAPALPSNHPTDHYQPATGESADTTHNVDGLPDYTVGEAVTLPPEKSAYTQPATADSGAGTSHVRELHNEDLQTRQEVSLPTTPTTVPNGLPVSDNFESGSDHEKAPGKALVLDQDAKPARPQQAPSRTVSGSSITRPPRSGARPLSISPAPVDLQ